MSVVLIYSYQGALDWINTHPNATINELKELVTYTSPGMADGSAPKVNLLYSGTIGPNSWASELIPELGKNPDIGTIFKTHVGSLLESETFETSIQNAVTNYNSSLPAGSPKLTLSEVMAGTNADGTRVNKTSMWDIASAKYAHAADNVMTITPFAAPNSIFADSEIGSWLNNGKDNVKIDGIPKSDLQKIYSDVKLSGGSDFAAITAVRETVQAKSYDRIVDIEFVRDPDSGKVTKVGFGEKFASGIDNLAPSHITSEIDSNIKHVSEIMPKLKDVDIQKVNTLVSGLGHLQHLGNAVDILTVSIAIFKANEAYAAGDAEGAVKIMEDWAAEFIGGTAAGLWASNALIGVLAGTPIGVVTAGIIVIVGAMGAGYLGGEAAKKFVDAYEYLIEKVEQLGIYLAEDIQKFDIIVQELWDQLSDLVDDISNGIDSAYHKFLDAVARSLFVDPLVIDMAGDGLSLDSWQKSNALFDLDANGTKENTGWTKANDDDAFLVIDKNNNGNVDNIMEMFGNAAMAGFTDLKSYDSNGDNLINASDSQFNLMKLWNDKNANGVVDTGELTTLAANGITQISLNKYSDREMIEGNLQTAISEVTFANGTVRNIHELSFGFDGDTITTSGDRTLTGFKIKMEALLLPYSRGYSNLFSWQVAANDNFIKFMAAI